MKKIIKGISFLLMIFVCNIFINDVNAASATIGVSSNKSTVVVGDTVTYTITVSSSTSLGSWEFDLKYDSNLLSLSSSNLEGSTTAANNASSSGVKSKTYTVKFKAKKSGTAKVYVTNSGVWAWDTSKMGVTNGSKSVTIKTQAEIDSSKSSVNTLKALSVSGYNISPKFDKNTLNYSVTVPNNVTKVTINATKTDSKATVSGAGARSVSEGVNNLKVTVKAENGSTKVYTIKVTVEELSPVTVKINGEEYTVVRKSDKVTCPNNYSKTTVSINDNTVPACVSEVTKYKLVSLTRAGDANFYIYDNDSYTKYNENRFNGLTLYIMNPSDSVSIEGAEKTTVKIDEVEYTAYSLKNLKYPLLYGMNVETGNTSWYSYDSEEGTLQRLAGTENVEVKVEEVKEDKKDEKCLTSDISTDKFVILSIILGCITGILFITLIIMVIRKNKKEELII